MADYSTSQRIGFSAEPLSSYQIPLFTKDRRNEYVNYGEDNNYPQYLCDLFNRSAKHNAILTAKQKWTYGKGLKVRKDENLDSMIKAQQLLSKPNQFESLNDIFKKLALDKRLYGGYALQIIWDRGGQKIAKIFHVDFSKVRSSVDNSKFFYSNNWADKKETILEFNAFNPDRRKGLQLYYCKDYRPTLKTYPLPDYIAAVPYIEVDVEIANYHRANIQNEFFFGGILNFNNGVPTDEEQKDLVRRINRKHQGTNNAGRWIINFSDGADKAPNVIPIQPNDLDKQFDILNKTVQEELFVAHRVTSPMLLGIKTEGQLGGRTEMVDAYKLFDLNEIKPDQQHFEELFNYFAAINGAINAYEVLPLDLPSPTLSEDTLVKVATESELRIMLGLPAEKPTNEVVVEEKQTFAKEWTKDIEVFAQFGESADDYIEITSTQVHLFEDAELFERQLEAGELQMLDEGRQKFAEIEANTPEENKVLEYVKKNPISTKANIARETGLTESQVETIINSLRAASVLSLVEGAWSINNKRPSKALVDRIADEINRLEVKYKYTGPKDSKNREFCAALLDLNKVYTRKEIDTISKRVGYNVWNKRGGWQTIKGTDIHLPFCRHTWNSVLTQKKKR
jgi:DNA-binding MarR family transcriptional regulator